MWPSSELVDEVELEAMVDAICLRRRSSDYHERDCVTLVKRLSSVEAGGYVFIWLGNAPKVAYKASTQYYTRFRLIQLQIHI